MKEAVKETLGIIGYMTFILTFCTLFIMAIMLIVRYILLPFGQWIAP